MRKSGAKSREGQFMLRVEENPPAQSPVVEDLASAPGRWWVAHTRSRCEKALAWDLLRRGIVYFLPMVERVRMSGGRKRRFLLPLFPSYLKETAAGETGACD